MTPMEVTGPGGVKMQVMVCEKADPPPPAPARERLPRKNIKSECREMIARVYHFMKGEAYNGVQRAGESRWRTAQACGISENTVSRVLREERSGRFREPGAARRRRRAVKSELDAAHAQDVLVALRGFEARHGRVPTLCEIEPLFREEVGYTVCRATLRRVLTNLGYLWSSQPGPAPQPGPSAQPGPSRPGRPAERSTGSCEEKDDSSEPIGEEVEMEMAAVQRERQSWSVKTEGGVEVLIVKCEPQSSLSTSEEEDPLTPVKREPEETEATSCGSPHWNEIVKEENPL